MAITTSNLQKLLTGGASNTDPNLSLGGAPSTTQLVNSAKNNLFNKVTAQQAEDGLVDYRCEALKNNHGSLVYKAVKVWIRQNTSSGDTSVKIGASAQGINAAPTAISDDETAPSGVSYTTPATEAAAISIGDIPAGQYFCYWTERTVEANAAAAADQYQIEVIGETDA